MERAPPRLLMPDAPAVVAGPRHVAMVSADGEVETLEIAAAARRLGGVPVLACHAPALGRRLRLAPDRLDAFDVLELFAFVCPARFCLPTPRGLAVVLDLPPPAGLADEAATLFRVVEALLRRLSQPQTEERSDPVALAWTLGVAGWRWAPAVLAALGAPGGPAQKAADAGLAVWRRLPEWSVEAPEPPPAQLPVEPAEARRRLAELVRTPRRPGGSGESTVAEARPQQSDYADALAAAFTPRAEPGVPNLVLAEAGTGVGKTLGYLAPASLWAEKNRGAVWISTYTRNLQHQIDAELDRLYPDPTTKARKVVLRKGRENYLCLLNFEEATRSSGLDPRFRIALGLLARWIAATRDGDLQGSDFPGWLVDVLGRAATLGLADRRGECIYSGCEHYNRCFIEKSVRRARRADIVIANHALVMIQAAQGGGDDSWLPTRYVFDEGHHVFEAADGAFAAHLTGLETRELRRWLLGADADGRSSGGGRTRGLKRRLDELISGDDKAAALLEDVLQAARALPADGWRMRLAGDNPTGPTERFLHQVRKQVLARAGGSDSPYSIETETIPPIDGLLESARTLREALGRLAGPLTALAQGLAGLLDDEAADLESDQRRRIDAVARGLTRRTDQTVRPWLGMLESLGGGVPVGFIDWFGLERHEGRELDVGMYRHWVDPTLPFSQVVLGQAHGAAITSATLTDGSGNPERDWQAAELRTGAVHVPKPAWRVTVPSPFNYAKHTRVLVVTDVRKDDLPQVAAAYRELFLAARGGALGLFTAITRLRAVHARIAEALDGAGLPLYAQHVDGLDVATLIDIFRAEESACLLGTDAVRDGIDVPGRSLHLIVFDRVPWPRPSILHKARREHFGGRRYDDMLTRLRLKQAFGRLIRRADDTGVFVLLDPLMPSRLNGAFPEGVEVQRVGLAEAVRVTREFLG